MEDKDNTTVEAKDRKLNGMVVNVDSSDLMFTRGCLITDVLVVVVVSLLILANKERASSEVCCEYHEHKSGTPADCTSLGISKARTSLILAWRSQSTGAVGALDGTLIHEGVAHDSRILSEAIRNQNAPFPLPPPDKYYLCDAAYAHTRGFMVSYRNVRYWLGDFWRRRPLNGKEKFKHSHAKLRNVIERAYGVLKARFPILKRMTHFSLTTQRNITIACFALHNFIRKEGLDDELFSTYDQSNVQRDNENVLVEDDEGIEDKVVQP
ncbi:Myb/SANT-like domain, harbinger transposase-derived nuclease domain protein [Tanacetum coccineum]